MAISPWIAIEAATAPRCGHVSCGNLLRPGFQVAGMRVHGVFGMVAAGFRSEAA